VVGGGIIGLEMACVYAALGSAVTVVEFMDQLMPARTRPGQAARGDAEEAQRRRAPEDQGREDRGEEGRPARRLRGREHSRHARSSTRAGRGRRSPNGGKIAAEKPA
jgi:dihydrolipoamide dehydrogenase